MQLCDIESELHFPGSLKITCNFLSLLFAKAHSLEPIPAGSAKMTATLNEIWAVFSNQSI